MATRQRQARWQLSYVVELEQFFRGEYEASAGLQCAFGHQLDRARDGLGNGTGTPDTLPPQCVEMGARIMPEKTIRRALGRMRPAYVRILRVHYARRPPGSDWGLLGLQPWVGLTCMTAFARKLARRAMAEHRAVDTTARRNHPPDMCDLENAIRRVNSTQQLGKGLDRAKAKANLKRAQRRAQALLERAHRAYASSRAVRLNNDLDPSVDCYAVAQ